MKGVVPSSVVRCWSAPAASRVRSISAPLDVWLPVSVFALLPALAGMAAGRWLRQRISDRIFRTCLFAFLIVLGLNLMRAAVF